MSAQQPKPINFALATDGSERAEMAFKTLMNEFLGPHDIVNVITVADKKKEYLNEQYKPDNILKTYKNFLISHVS